MNWLTTNYNCEDYPTRDRAYNNILSMEVTSPASGTDPLTLDEIKAHLRVDFADDDTSITFYAKGAREQIEQEYNVSLAARRIKVRIRSDKGNLDLPFGPVINIIAVNDYDGTAITDYTINNGVVMNRFYNETSVEYDAGFSVCPFNYKQLMLERISYLYEHRGDEKKQKGGIWLI